jgi:hypothetical protein
MEPEIDNEPHQDRCGDDRDQGTVAALFGQWITTRSLHRHEPDSTARDL